QKVPTDSHTRGIGLGLSIAQSLAKVHSGKVKVQSIVDKGTTFTVILPILSSPPKSQEAIYTTS
ncbi:MAG: hypothetical protein KKF78_04980, partial [Candidatus Omnitrophica bacterium]|nr:hypothetical protein [Candidatus Omnitrophota bacterium]